MAVRRPTTGAGLWLAICAASLGGGAGSVLAQDGDLGFVLDPIIIRDADPSTDRARPFSSAGETVILREQLLTEFPGASLTTVLDTFPGVTTNTVAGDPGIGVSIRGLQDDGRVGVTIDGARQTFGRSGHSANQTFVVDPEMLRSVSVVRGPTGPGAATGAIGGTLALRTVAAEDLIAPGATHGGEVRLRYGTLTAEPTLHGAFAQALDGGTTLLLAGTRVEADDYTAPNGRDVVAEQSNRSLLFKLGREVGAESRVTLGISVIGSDYFTGQEVLPRRNRLDTLNATLNFEGSLGRWDAVEGTLFYTGSRVAQRRIDDDRNAIGPERSYSTDTVGFRGTAETDHSLFGADNRLVLLLDMLQDDVTVDDPTADGGSLTAPGTRQLFSVLAENTTALSDRTDLVLGLRFDAYDLDSREGQSEGTQVSPSLLLRHQLGAVTVHGLVARAFRPPSLSESLVNGRHPEPADFLILPNPNLKPERAMTYEIGATLGLSDVFFGGDRLDARLALFRNDVQDYIALEEKGTLFNAFFQFENVDQVVIEGAEFELSYDAEFLFARLSGQTTTADEIDSGEEIVSGIAPDQYSFTAGWRSDGRLWEIGTRYTRTEARDNGALSSEAWNTWDLFLNRSIGDNGAFSLALNNVTDETYTPYLTTEPAPGFNALASISLNF